MENYKSESSENYESDNDSNESDSSATSRRVAPAASALHSLMGGARPDIGRHERPPERPIAAPALGQMLAAEHFRQQQEAQARALHEKKKDDDEEESDTSPSTAAPSVKPGTPPAKPTPKISELLPEIPPESELATVPATELTDEEVDREFQKLVDIDLHTIDHDALPEPEALDPPVAKAEEYTQNIAHEIPLHETRPEPVIERQPVSARPENAADFAAWEAELHEPTPPIENTDFHATPPFPEAFHAEHPQPGQPPEQAGTGGGGNQPPTPPNGPSMEMPASGAPDPGNQYNLANFALNPNYGQPAPHESFMNALAAPISLADRLAINARIQRAEMSRRRGDAVTGLIAGWALFRTFRNRRMIRHDRRETEKRTKTQEHVNREHAQQNESLRQRLAQVENRQVAVQPAMPNRFRPTGTPAETAGVGVMPAAEAAGATAGLANAEKASQSAAEKARVITQEQREAVLRRDQLEVPPEHEIVHSNWLSIERDKKTGRVAEQPTSFEYGAAFHEERRREQLQDPLKDATQPPAAAPAFFGSAGAGTVIGGSSSGLPPDDARLYAGTTAASGFELSRANGQSKAAGKQVKSTLGSLWFWGAVVALLIVFFAAALF